MPGRLMWAAVRETQWASSSGHAVRNLRQSLPRLFSSPHPTNRLKSAERRRGITHLVFVMWT